MYPLQGVFVLFSPNGYRRGDDPTGTRFHKPCSPKAGAVGNSTLF
jgi:hypothetical protein